MTNVSRNGTETKAYQAGHKKLCELIANLNTEQSSTFLRDLFTESEQIMYVKRFAAVCMFAAGHTPYRAATSLEMSQSTAARLYCQYQDGAFASLVRYSTPKQRDELVSVILDLVCAKGDIKARRRIYKRIK